MLNFNVISSHLRLCSKLINNSLDKGIPSVLAVLYVMFKKYKTFSVLIYSYINTSGNWKDEKLCGNTGR